MADEKRLIDANALKWKLCHVTLYVPWLRFVKKAINKILESYWQAVFEEIDNAPTVDAAPVVNGRWIRRETNAMFLWKLECSVCGNDLFATAGYNYCPNCGAKMDGEPHD